MQVEFSMADDRRSKERVLLKIQGKSVECCQSWTKKRCYGGSVGIYFMQIEGNI